MSDALLALLKRAHKRMRPKSRLSVSEWADQYRHLSNVGSAEQGRWRTARTPFLREIMDQLSEHAPARLVAFMKSGQVGGTEAGVNWLGYIIDHAKGPVAVIMPTEKSMTDWMTQKFDPMVDASPRIKAALARRSSTSADNNMARKKFVGGVMFSKTAGSTSELKSTSLRYALVDEVDEYGDTSQGDPVKLIDVRQTTFHDRKTFVPSTPTIKGVSRIESLYLGGDQRRYHVPCPYCGTYQPLEWSRVVWKVMPGKSISEAAAYTCVSCDEAIAEHHKTDMLANGRWLAQAPGAPYPSYHINALYSPIGLGLTWKELADEWLLAQDDPSRLQVFVNTRLGEPWEDRSTAVKPQHIKERAEAWRLRTVPPGCLLLTAGVDTQDDRLAVQIVGWGEGERSFIIDWLEIPGSPAEWGTWLKLVDLLRQPIITARGNEMRVQAVAVDSGGHHTAEVYKFAASGLLPRLMAIKGHNLPGKPVLGPRPSKKKGLRRYEDSVWMVGGDTAKHVLFNRLHGDRDKPAEDRLIRFSSDLTDSDYFEQLTSEAFNPRKNRFQKLAGRRNEALDTWVYAYAAAHHPEIRIHRMRPIDWKRLREALHGDETAVDAVDHNQAKEPTKAAPAVDLPTPLKRPPRRGGFARNWR